METRSKMLERGFTLIELMIVIAIIGILASIAVYSYRDYTTRAQVAEGITLTTRAQLGLAEFYVSNGRLPMGGNDSIGLPLAAEINGNYVKSVQSLGGGQGKILLTFGNQANAVINGKQCTFSPVLPSSASPTIRWSATCQFSNRYLPSAYK